MCVITSGTDYISGFVGWGEKVHDCVKDKLLEQNLRAALWLGLKIASNGFLRAALCHLPLFRDLPRIRGVRTYNYFLFSERQLTLNIIFGNLVGEVVAWWFSVGEEVTYLSWYYSWLISPRSSLSLFTG